MPAGRPKQAFLCTTCNDSDPDNFYKSRKHQCKKCELNFKQTSYEKQRVNKKIIVREIDGKYSTLINGLNTEIKFLSDELVKQRQISDELFSKLPQNKTSPKRSKITDSEQRLKNIEVYFELLAKEIQIQDKTQNEILDRLKKLEAKNYSL
jgi:hypothetical protein